MIKKISFLLIVVLLLIIGGVFLWKNREIKGSPEDYIIKDTEEGKTVKNEKANLEFEVPDGWEIEKLEIEEGSIILYSPEAEGIRPGKIRPPLKKGCMIEIAVAYRSTSFEELEGEIRKLHEDLGVKLDEIEISEINGMPALRNRFDSTDLGLNIDIYILSRNSLYGLGIALASEDEEECLREFDIFLNTVSIK